MADEFRTPVCGGSWFNPLRINAFGSSPCASSIVDMGSFGWSSDFLDMKLKYTNESDSVSDGSLLFQDMQKTQQQPISSSLQMTDDWNHTLLGASERIDDNYQPMLQEDLNSSLNYHEKQMNSGFSLDQQPLNCITSSGENTATCQGLSTSFPLSSASYNYPATLLQTLFNTDPQQEQSLFETQSMNYSSKTNFQTNLNEFLPSSDLQSTNKPFWNASDTSLNNIRSNFLPPTQSQLIKSTFEEKLNLPNLTSELNNEEGQGQLSISILEKTIDEPVFKRPRIITPSPLPTFKVRKEKLGDRITALQQLVSPFGKTDTASVLHEAIDCIKFLHDQVNVLSAPPYTKNGTPVQPQQTPDKIKDQEGLKQDLRSRGLCLMPISSTFTVAAETTADFWPPTFGGTFR